MNERVAERTCLRTVTVMENLLLKLIKFLFWLEWRELGMYVHGVMDGELMSDITYGHFTV